MEREYIQLSAASLSATVTGHYHMSDCSVRYYSNTRKNEVPRAFGFLAVSDAVSFQPILEVSYWGQGKKWRNPRVLSHLRTLAEIQTLLTGTIH
jgi:hypothetical protein